MGVLRHDEPAVDDATVQHKGIALCPHDVHLIRGLPSHVPLIGIAASASGNSRSTVVVLLSRPDKRTDRLRQRRRYAG